MGAATTASQLLASLQSDAAAPGSAQQQLQVLRELLQAFDQACEDAKAAAAKGARGGGMDIRLLAKEAGLLALGEAVFRLSYAGQPYDARQH